MSEQQLALQNLTTYQFSGAGNTFSVMLETNFTALNIQRIEFVKKVCAETNTDGFVFLSWINQLSGQLAWDFYNNDGSAAEMCGNATRCVAAFAKTILAEENNTFKIQTVAGSILVRCLGKIKSKSQDLDQYQVQMTALQKFDHAKYFWCDTGVPHIVIEIPDYENFKSYKEFCKNLRAHSDFGAKGTNVTLVKLSILKKNEMQAVSYERGVEDFTMACGTGAVAAAFYNLEKRFEAETFVEMPGGCLKMDLTDLKKPLMTGPAVHIGTHQITL